MTGDRGEAETGALFRSSGDAFFWRRESERFPMRLL
jgi:hypothetical protein